MLVFGSDANIWRWQPHPEVWLILAGAAALAWYAVRVIGPKVQGSSVELFTSRQRVSFIGGLAVLWLASDWPLHDIAEEYLYFVHMVQHLLITFIAPALLLLAVPEWLARLMVSEDGKAGIWLRRLSRPVAAGFLFNFFAAVTHITWVVNTSVDNGVFHYAVHLAVFSSALLMWIPIISPLPELQSTPPGKMIFLFMMSILPTIPAAFLTFAERPLYSAYNHPVRLWGITVAQDQQAAGVVMKLGGGIFLWIVIGFIFFRWSAREGAGSTRMRTVLPSGEAVLTYEEVQHAFDNTRPPRSVESTPEC